MTINHEERDLVSVVITTFNRNEYLKETLYSIQNQSYPFIEILLIDDGSDFKISRRNKEIAKCFSKCKYYYKKNTGQPDSRNFGISKSKGVYIGFCDDDDYWVLSKIEKQLSVLKLNPIYSIVTGCIEYVKENSEKTGDVKCHEGHNHGSIFENLLIKNRTASITPLLKREVFNKVGYFNPNFTIAEDWEFWRRLSYYYKFYNIKQVLAYVRLHPENMSKSRTGEPLENYKLYRKLTIALIKWGQGRFNTTDYNLVYSYEWQQYRQIMTNHYPGFLNKFKFLKRVFFNDISDGFHILSLIMKYEILKWK